MEFGEKVKSLREAKGMTQQTLAEQIYVTRQAVSRWECGARFPDLLTAKKIAQILEVSIDELVSGEELKEKMEKEPVLARPAENVLQTILYTVGAAAYLLMCVFSIFSFIPNGNYAHDVTTKINANSLSTAGGYLICFIIFMMGLILSGRNRLTPKITGRLMAAPYLVLSLSFLILFVNATVRSGGHTDILSWFPDILPPFIAAVYILLYFQVKERRFPCIFVLLICILSLGNTAYIYCRTLPSRTDTGIAVGSVHALGRLVIPLLLGYQAYILDKKRKIACSPIR